MKKTGKVLGLGISLLTISTLMACSSISKLHSSSKEDKTEVTSSTSEKKGIIDKAKEKLGVDKFDPQDTSDQTIESIKTYEDYLIMYEKIIQDYFDQCEAVYKEKGLGDDASFEEQKKSLTQSMEDQKKQYGALKNSPIQGKEHIVQFLKEYRDSLKELVDQLAAS